MHPRSSRVFAAVSLGLNNVQKKNNKRGANRRVTQNKTPKNCPPQIKSNVELNHRYRFTSTSATPTALTGNSILCCAGAMGTNTNAFVTSLFNTARIKLIEIWTPPASQGAAATCSVDWVGYGNAPNREFSDTTVSVATPAHVRTSPPQLSLASFWLNNTIGSVCTITAPVGSIIDIALELILSDDDEASQTVVAVATAVVGTSYYMSLDPNATHRFVPVSLTTTI